MPDDSPQSEVAKLLQKCALFRDLERPDLEPLAAHAARRKYDAGVPIFHAGDPGESLMGVLAGEVRISRRERTVGR